MFIFDDISQVEKIKISSQLLVNVAAIESEKNTSQKIKLAKIIVELIARLGITNKREEPQLQAQQPDFHESAHEDRTLFTPDDGEIPVFETLDEAMAWMEFNAKARKISKSMFASSTLYHKAYEQIQLLHDTARSGYEDAAWTRLSDAGLSIGDNVVYRGVGMFMQNIEHTGVIVKRKGLPYVLLDNPMDVVSKGKMRLAKEVRWDSRFEKINTENNEANQKAHEDQDAPAAKYFNNSEKRTNTSRQKDNDAAFATLQKIQAEGRTTATDEEKAVLAKYSGLGGGLTVNGERVRLTNTIHLRLSQRLLGASCRIWGLVVARC